MHILDFIRILIFFEYSCWFEKRISVLNLAVQWYIFKELKKVSSLYTNKDDYPLTRRQHVGPLKTG